MRLRDDNVPCCTPEFWIFLAICLALVSFAGITSGLALGLLSFGQVDLEVLIKAGQPHESKYAAKILPLVKNEHLLLCTLLVAKSLAMEALPIFLDSILPFWVAILMSVTLALAFAEIIPQAVCSRYGLQLGAKLAFLVRLLLLIFFPISYPISKVLDWLLGRAHSALYRRSELKTLVDLHANEAGKGGELTHHETTIIAGALELTEKTAKDAMTPISETFSLDINSKLDMITMGLIMSKGHSRVPIYSGNTKNIVGLILVKNLIFCRPEEETPIKHMTIRKIPRVYEDWPLYEILNLFQEGHSHMAIVLKKAPRENTSKSLPTGFSTHTSPLYYSIDLEAPICNRTDVKEERSREMNRRWWLGSGTFSHKDLESLPSFSGEEVIGIITMEDVMEELLQKEILDETDEYVDLHKKIRINLPSSRRSSSSPARVSISRHQCQTQELSRPCSTAPTSYAQISPAPDSSPTDTPGHASISSAGSIGKSLLSHSHKGSRKMNKKLDPMDP